jgi:predicted Zn-dependent protease
VVTHAILGNLAESLTACRQLVAVQPRRADPHARLAHLLLMADDPQGALSELRIAAQLDPRYPGINALMAQAREAAAGKRSDRADEQRPAGGLPPIQ